MSSSKSFPIHHSLIHATVWATVSVPKRATRKARITSRLKPNIENSRQTHRNNITAAPSVRFVLWSVSVTRFRCRNELPPLPSRGQWFVKHSAEVYVLWWYVKWTVSVWVCVFGREKERAVNETDKKEIAEKNNGWSVWVRITNRAL